MSRRSEKLECAGALRALIVAGERYRHAVADRYGLGVSETLVLSAVCRAGEPLTPREISEHLMVRSGTLTAILDRLEAAGMIERLPHPTDRRGRLIALTQQGESVLSYSTSGLSGALTQATKTVPAAELAGLLTSIAGDLEAATTRVHGESPF